MNSRVEIRSVYIAPDESPVDAHIITLNKWKTRSGDRFAPSWNEYTMMDFPLTEIPCISLTDISITPFRSTYRFWGTGLTQVFGGDYTGKTPADVPPKSLGMNVNGGCARLINDRAPHYEVKEFLRDNGIFGRAMVLRLPFSDDGETVNHGLNMYKFERWDSNDSLTSYFDEVFSVVEDQLPSQKSPQI